MNPNLDTFLAGLAQLETAGGKKSIKGPNGEDSFNYYNIKDFSDAGTGYRAFDKAEKSNHRYRVYKDPEESKRDVIDLLSRKYPGAVDAQSPEDFANALVKGGYATDPEYFNKLTGVIKSKAGAAPVAATAASIDLAPYLEKGWGPHIEQAKQQGFTDNDIKFSIDEYAKGLQGKSDKLAEVDRSYAAGDDISKQIALLRTGGYADAIEQAKKQGFSDEDILYSINPEGYEKAKAAKALTEKRGVVGNLFEGAKDRVQDLGMAGRQIESRITGNDAELAQEQAEQQATAQSLERAATGGTTSGKIGGFLPDVAAGIATLPVGGPITGQLAKAAGSKVLGRTLGGAGAGATYGASTPTTADGQFADNIALGAAVGGGAALIPGLASGTASAYKAGGKAAEDLKGRVTQRGAVEAEENTLFAREVTRRAGNESDTLDSNWVAETKAQLGKTFDDAYKGLDVEIPTKLTDDVLDLTTSGRLPSEYRRELTRLLYTRSDNGLAPKSVVSAEDFNRIIRSAEKDISSQSISAFKREAISELIEKVKPTFDEALEKTTKAGELRAAREAYRHFVAARDMVAKSGDSVGTQGVEKSAKMLKQTIKGGKNKTRFAEGRAPYQDLVKRLEEIEGKPDTSFIPQDIKDKAIAKLGSLLGVPIPALRFAAAPLRRLLQSGDPKVREVFYQLSPVEQNAVLRSASEFAPNEKLAAAIRTKAESK